VSLFGDRFRNVARLGEGGLGVVYRAEDYETGTDVALKTLARKTPEELYRLKEEFRALRRVRHRNLVRLYDLVVTDDLAFFTMEFVDGVAPGDFVRTEMGLDLARTVGLARQLVHGVAAIHAAAKLHRDVKPSNILVRSDGRVVLLDFGLVAALPGEGGSLDTLGKISGTILYMSPEQMRGRGIGTAADWYAVGAVLYEILTGRVPFEGRMEQLLVAKQRGAPTAPSLVEPAAPPAFDALVTALLDPEPSRRLGGEEILAELDQISSRLAAHEIALPLPRLVSTPLLGRERELQSLRASFSKAHAGSPVAVRIKGPSGIGKSALVSTFLRSLGPEVCVLRSRCHPQESMPYKALDPAVDELSQLLLQRPREERTRCVPENVGALVKLFPVLARVPEFALAQDAPSPALEQHELRNRGFTALRDLLGGITGRGPLVMWLDDLQWGDLDSALLLRHLIGSPDLPLLLILSYRSEESIPCVDALAADLSPGTAAVPAELPLPPLDAESSAAVLRAHEGGAQRSAEELARLVRDADGSPFLLTVLARQLLRATDEDPSVDDRLSVEHIVDRQLRDLASSDHALLELLCVAGEPVDRELLLEAAGTGPRGRLSVDELEADSFLRSTLRNGRASVEVYHDRIREEMLRRLSGHRTRFNHERLADVLLRAPAGAPETLLRHLIGAQRHLEAAVQAIRAADAASTALAFDHAAKLYRQALDLLPEEDSRRPEVSLGRAEALVNAGRGTVAAPIFVDLASRSPHSAALDFRRRAAEQLLTSGHFDAGLTLLRNVLQGAGIRYPATAARALVGVVLRLGVLGARGASFTERPGGAAVDERRRIELCFSASKGHIVVDPAKGAYFALLGLLRALSAGDPHGVARGLAVISGAILVPAGGPMGRWGERLLARAEQIATAHDDPYLRGITAISKGQAHLFAGRWRLARESSDHGVQVLSDSCRGVAWECAIGRMGAIRASEELGEMSDMLARASEMLRDGQERGDVYAEVTGHNYVGTALLAQGELAAARAHAARTQAIWTHEGAHVPRIYATRIDVSCDLRDGDPGSALRQVESLWPDLKRAGLLRVPITRVDALLLRGRATLAVAARSRELREKRIGQVEKLAGSLAAMGRADTTGHAAMLRAMVALLRERRVDALTQLDAATASFGQAEMQLAEQLARHCSARLRDHAEGREHADRAAQSMRELGVTDLPAWLAIQAPVLGSTAR
jgi:serine/threonine protein kinase